MISIINGEFSYLGDSPFLFRQKLKLNHNSNGKKGVKGKESLGNKIKAYMP